MTETIFAAVVTHFETGQSKMRFGNTIYEIYPGHKDKVHFFVSNGNNEPSTDARHLTFDEACKIVAVDIEKEILNYWRPK